MIYVFFHLATQVWSWLSPSRKPIKLRNHVSTLWIVFCLSWDSCEGAGDVGLPVLPLVVCVSKLIILFFCYPLPKVTTCIELVNSFLCPPFIFSELASASSLHVSERFCSKFFLNPCVCQKLANFSKTKSSSWFQTDFEGNTNYHFTPQFRQNVSLKAHNSYLEYTQPTTFKSMN